MYHYSSSNFLSFHFPFCNQITKAFNSPGHFPSLCSPEFSNVSFWGIIVILFQFSLKLQRYSHTPSMLDSTFFRETSLMPQGSLSSVWKLFSIHYCIGILQSLYFHISDLLFLMLFGRFLSLLKKSPFDFYVTFSVIC